VETTKKLKIPSSDEIYYPESINYREKKAPFKGLLTLFFERAVCLMVAHFTRGAALVAPRTRVLARHQRPLAPGWGKRFYHSSEHFEKVFTMNLQYPELCFRLGLVCSA
jgi:hypothetical protein